MTGPTVWEQIANSVLLFLPRLATAVVVLLVFWLVAGGVRRVIQRLGAAKKADSGMVYLLAQTARIGLLALGVISALGTLGIDVTPLVAGLGLTGLALGLALKEIISNAVSGVLVIVSKPFKENDFITVTTFEGTVREINLRFTALDAGEKKIYIPNAMMISNAVVVHRSPPAQPTATPPAATSSAAKLPKSEVEIPSPLLGEGQE